MSYLIKNLHFIVNHVPIAMLIFSFIFDLLAVILKKKEWHTAGFLTLIVGTLGAIAAVITGPNGQAETRNPDFHNHQLFGNLTMYLYIIISLVRLFFYYRKKIDIGKMPIYLIIGVIGVSIVTYTGHLGGKMAHRDTQGGFNVPGGANGQGGRPGGQGRPNGQGGPNGGPAGKNLPNNNATTAPEK
jgi:uncharacterized membrane protein